jgi:hypothetical protein
MTQTTEAPKPQTRSRGHLCPVYITLARPMRRSKGEKSPADPLAPITAPAMLRSCNCHRPATGAATALEPGSGAHHAALPCRRSPLPVPGTAPLKPVPALALLCRRCCEVAAVKSSLLCRRSPPMPPPPCPRHRGGCWCRPPDRLARRHRRRLCDRRRHIAAGAEGMGAEMAARRALFTQHMQRAFAAEVIEYGV